MPAAQAQQPPVILVFGDSLSAGYGLPQGRGWVDLLQQRLDTDRQRLRVVNTSISGETTLGGRNRLPAVLTQHRPRLVILQLGANDALRGQSLNGMRDNLEEMIRASREAKAEVLLVGMQIPPNYGQQYTQKFQAVFTEVARRHKVALVPFLLEGFADQPRFFQPDGVHPTVQAQTMMLDNVWSVLSPLLPRLR
ncbi:MAG: arylesterase [Burkholderiales bacterium]|nr:arylesterase [Burkholderiales bacterium]